MSIIISKLRMYAMAVISCYNFKMDGLQWKHHILETFKADRYLIVKLQSNLSPMFVAYIIKVK